MPHSVKCSVYGCQHTNRTHKFNQFPRNDPARCYEWLRLCGNSALPNIPLAQLYKKSVCRDHFSPQMFWNNERKCLKRDAVPDMHLDNVTPLNDDQLLPAAVRLGLIRVVGTRNAAGSASTETPPPCVQSNAADGLPVTVPDEVETESVPMDVAVEEEVAVHIEAVQAENPHAGQEENSTSKSSQSKNIPKIVSKISQQRISKKSILTEAGVNKVVLSREESRLLEVAHKYKSKWAQSQRKVKETTSRLKELEKPDANFRALSDRISPALGIMLRGELVNEGRDPRGREWFEESKALYLAFKACSAKGYALMEQVFVVPSSRTLRNVTSQIPLEVGINDAVFDQLAQHVERMKPEEKFVNLMWDEFKGKGGLFFNEKKGIIIGYEDFGPFGKSNLPADTYLIFLIRSHDPNSDWKMPLAIFFALSMCPAEVLKKIIVLIITKLQNTGLRVASTVCDQGPGNRLAMRLLHEEASKKTGRVEPEIIVNEQTIVTFWDNPHAFKNLINNWRLDIHNIIEYGPPGQRKRAFYQHIIDYYEYDKKNYKVGLLSHEQVFPEGKQKMKVKNCTQPSGATVANTMKSYNQLSTRNGGDPILPGADDTADFMLKADYLFDVTNGSAPGNKPKPEQRAPVTETSFHHEAWRKMRKEVATWAYIDRNGKRIVIPCLQAFQENLLAYPALWKLLVREGQYTSYNLRHATQDPIENFIAQMRATLAGNSHPTPHQVAHAFKIQLINKHVKFSLGKGKNCQDDGAQMLTNLQSLLKKRKAHPMDKEEPVAGPSQLREGLESFPHIVRGLRAPQLAIEEKLLKSNAIIGNSAMGAALLASQCLDGNSCRLCENMYTSDDPENRVLNMLLQSEDYHKVQRNVLTPSFYLVQVYQAMTDKVNSIAKKHLDPANMLSRVMVVLDDDDFFREQCPQHGAAMRNKTVQLASRLLIKNYCKMYTLRWKEESQKLLRMRAENKKLERSLKDNLQKSSPVASGGEGQSEKQVEQLVSRVPPRSSLPVQPGARSGNLTLQQEPASCSVVHRVVSPVPPVLGRGQGFPVQTAHRAVHPLARGGPRPQQVATPRMKTPVTQPSVSAEQPLSKRQQILMRAYQTPIQPRVNLIPQQRPAGCTLLPSPAPPVLGRGRGQMRPVQTAPQIVLPVARGGPRPHLVATPRMQTPVTQPSASVRPDRQPTAKRNLMQNFDLTPQPIKKRR